MKNRFVPVILFILLGAAASAQRPRQEWNKPFVLMKGFGEAIEALLGNGLSDPRGTGELAVFELLIGEGRGEPRRLVEAYGWPIPNTNKAVIIDGLTYEVTRRVRSASLKELVSKFNYGVGSFDDILQPTEAIVPLLLVRGDIAAFQTLAKQSSWGPVSLASGLHCRYRMQIAQAMADGRDEEALAWAGQLVKLEQAGIDFDYSRLFNSHSGERVLASVVFEDIARRVSDKQARPSLEAIKTLSQGARITALIKGLEDVGPQPQLEFSGPNPEDHPFVKALIAEGVAAIPALLDALEFDNRLTRTFIVGSPTMIVRWHHPVRYLAATVLNAIPTERIGQADPQGKSVKRLRESYVEWAMAKAQWAKPVAPKLTTVDWTPPASKLPADYVEHARALLGNGLSDPRGAGELHRLSISVTREVFDSTEETETYGWPLPETGTAVCLDGLTYPVNKILRPANVQDVLADIRNADLSFRRAGWPWDAAPALFLMRGEVVAAEQIAEAKRSRSQHLFKAVGTRHRLAMKQYLDKGTNQLAVDAAEHLFKVQLVWHQFANPLDPEEVSPSIPSVANMRKAVQLRVISSVDKVDLSKLSSQPKSYRIETLIKLLDRTKLYSQGSLLSVTGQCPIMTALIAEGSDIVDPLLDVTQRDERLTISLASSSNLSGYTGVITVKDVARAAIFAVWPESRNIIGVGTKVEYSALKMAWDSAVNNSPAERVLRLLVNDQSASWHFERNCWRLTTPSSPGGSRLFESLSLAQQREFTDLLLAIWRRNANGLEMGSVGTRLMISHELAKVDPLMAMPFVEKSIDSALLLLDSSPEKTHLANRLETIFGTSARLRIPGTAAKYAKFLALQTDITRIQPEAFGPMMVAPKDDMQMQKVSEHYFGSWIKVARDHPGPKISPFREMVGLASSGLLAVPAYRKFLAEALTLKGKFGDGRISDKGTSYFVIVSPPYGDPDYEPTYTFRFTPGAVLPPNSISQGEYVALRLSYLAKCPRFVLGASDSDRAKNLQEIAKWLKDPSINWSEMSPRQSSYGESVILPPRK